MKVHKFQTYYIFISCIVIVLLMMACTMSQESNTEMMTNSDKDQAAVTGVSCSGQPNNYTLSVTIASPDTGCDQYADWWEVFTPDGVLIYRRILGHSHVNEQPFTRSGGSVDVGPDEFIYVRAHMNNLGYGSLVYSGTLRDDLQPDTLDTNFAIGLATTAPLPDDCAF